MAQRGLIPFALRCNDDQSALGQSEICADLFHLWQVGAVGTRCAQHAVQIEAPCQISEGKCDGPGATDAKAGARQDRLHEDVHRSPRWAAIAGVSDVVAGLSCLDTFLGQQIFGLERHELGGPVRKGGQGGAFDGAARTSPANPARQHSALAIKQGLGPGLCRRGIQGADDGGKRVGLACGFQLCAAGFKLFQHGGGGCHRRANSCSRAAREASVLAGAKRSRWGRAADMPAATGA